MQIPEVRNLELDAFLILPLQRLCKYPLFLRQLINETPEHDPGHSSLVMALHIIGLLQHLKSVHF